MASAHGHQLAAPYGTARVKQAGDLADYQRSFRLLTGL